MARHLLGHYLNNGQHTSLKNHLDVCNFANRVDLHFRQRMKQIRYESVAVLVYILTDGQGY